MSKTRGYPMFGQIAQADKWPTSCIINLTLSRVSCHQISPPYRAWIPNWTTCMVDPILVQTPAPCDPNCANPRMPILTPQLWKFGRLENISHLWQHIRLKATHAVNPCKYAKGTHPINCCQLGHMFVRCGWSFRSSLRCLFGFITFAPFLIHICSHIYLHSYTHTCKDMQWHTLDVWYRFHNKRSRNKK